MAPLIIEKDGCSDGRLSSCWRCLDKYGTVGFFSLLLLKPQKQNSEVVYFFSVLHYFAFLLRTLKE